MKLNDPYRNIPKSELDMAKQIFSNLQSENAMQIGKSNGIKLTSQQRTFVGTNISTLADYTKNIQKWYGEFYLPNSTLIVEKGKQLPSKNLLETNAIFRKNGYLYVYFNFKTYINGVPHLQYIPDSINSENMNEGAIYNNSLLVFKYEGGKRASDDIITGGTH